jgi:hypothetical protein
VFGKQTTNHKIQLKSLFYEIQSLNIATLLHGSIGNEPDTVFHPTKFSVWDKIQ